MVALIATGLSACSDDGGRRGRSTGDGGTGSSPDGAVATSCQPDGPAVVCQGTVATVCNDDGTEASSRDCADEGQRCVRDVGCAVCQPGRTTCDGNDSMVCRADGSGFDLQETCDSAAGQACDVGTGVCRNLCEEAVSNNSYIGCEYFPTVTSNSGLQRDFRFAVVVANPQAVDADVMIERGGSAVETVTVPAGGLETVELDWVNELKNQPGEETSAIVRGGAYRLESSVPVTVYQFNPLNFRIPEDCANESIFNQDGECFSFSNDASLLLPTHVLTGNYIVGSRASQSTHTREMSLFGDVVSEGFATSPGFATIVGAEDGVTVNITVTAHIAAAADGSVSALSPGESGTFNLDKGDVLQLVTETIEPAGCANRAADETAPGSAGGPRELRFCDMTGRGYDLTGTEIRAEGKVAVLGGHNCAFVPYNRFACDHIEETMFPLETWGKDLLVSRTRSLRREPNLVRVVSGHDGNEVRFHPSSAHPNRTLDRGEHIELETTRDVRIEGSEAIMAVQFLVGQDYEGLGSSGMMGQGDPSMSLAIPTEQFRSEYTFLAPSSFTTNLVNVTASMGQEVMLDGAPVSGWQSAGGTDLRTAQVEISGGVHSIESGSGFGIVVYGFGSYTSFMYPGGLDFEMINVPF
jgi:hypothetical protein